MTEAKFTVKLQDWLRHKSPETFSARVEVKFVDLDKKKSLNYLGCLPDHQKKALTVRKMVFKLPDLGLQNPFDVICLGSTVPGFLVVQFYKRGTKTFYMIPIKRVLEDIDKGNKSMDEEKARHLGYKCEL